MLMFALSDGAQAAEKLNPIALVKDASGVVLVVLGVLVVASFLVWLIWFLKAMQLGKLASAQQRFEREAAEVGDASALVALGIQHKMAPGGRIIVEMAKRPRQHLTAEFLNSVARRALVTEQQRASSLMPTLSSIASAAPFVGLFGTVWGIMEAFLRIGMMGSASLPVVAPAIGEALIATAVGLVAAIPATIGYNYIDQRISNLLSAVEASSETWVEVLAADAAGRAHQQVAHGHAPRYGV